jgi:thiamine biosynthesis lipoprotein
MTAKATRRRFLFLAGGAGGLAALGMARATFAGLERVERTGHALGTKVSITALHEDPDRAARALDEAFAELERVEEVMSLYRPGSQLSRLNRDGVLEAPHPHLVAVLTAAADMHRRSGGAFDATVQPLWQLYASCRKAGIAPSPEAVEEARRKVDGRAIEVAPDRITLRGTGRAITLNGIAQGFACDRVRAVLAAHGVRHALLDTGELGAIGRRADGGRWTAGIQHPREPDAYLALAALDDRFLATSGDYEASFTADFRLNHILDPRTGRSPEEFSSVSVLARTGTEADALSTALFVLGTDRGLRLVEETPGADALFVGKDGRTRTTPGFPKVTS